MSDVEDLEQEEVGESEEENEQDVIETFKNRTLGKKGKVEIEYEREQEPKKRLKLS